MAWEIYYEKNKDRSARPLFLKAMAFLDPNASTAMDLGCGVGTESIELLRRGLEVHAIDQEAKAIEVLKSKVTGGLDKLHLHVSSFEAFDKWQEVDFFYAFHSLPFCSRDQFEALVDKTIQLVKPGGLYVVSLFGPGDEWVIDKKVNGLDGDTIKRKLSGFDILIFEEIKKISPAVIGGNKGWHILEVIARKI